ncbi:MAG: MG2 domain-containing protein [Gemmatales bacterium]
MYLDQKQRDAQWNKVREAIKKGLPQTAIKEIEPIIQSALEEKAYPEAIKAIASRIAYEGMIQGNKPEERITRMKAEIAKAPAEMKPVMEAILAQWYWHYFMHNRWRFMQRTSTAAAPSEDFTTWDLSRLFKEIDNQFAKALSNEEELKKIPIKEYDSLIEKGTFPDSYRPTLYDFVAFEALNFYGSGELSAAKAEDAFEIDASSPIHGARDAFMTWKPDTTDFDSPKLKAILLYQKLLQFHSADDDRSALLDADLHRLRFGHNHAYGEEKNALYKKRLKQIADENTRHELSSLALAELAGVVQSENDLVEARNIALQGKNRFPKSQGGIQCHNIIQGIETPHYQVNLERVWAKPYAKLHVDYKNLTKLYFRVYQADWDRLIKQNAYSRPEQLDDQRRQALMKQKPVAEWSSELPATEDYQQRSEEVSPPENLPAGFYFVVACPNPQFTSDGPPLSVSSFWVSELALVLRQDQLRGVMEGFVLDSRSGEPIDGAKVTPFIRNYQQNRLEMGKELVTDKNGLFRYAGPKEKPVIFLASARGQRISNDNDMYNYGVGQHPQVFEQVVFFTDRSIYRPGQTIRFKGIALKGDHDKLNYQTLSRQSITVQFLDPNQKEISKLQLVTNDVGSFSGSFTAPRDRLMGRMMIQSTGPQGIALFHVEEYKRPKFEVTVHATKDSPKLNDTVKFTGKAMGYSGAAVSGAKLRYRVSRQVRYPAWWGYYYWWRMPAQAGAAQEIAHGTSITEPDGTFSASFTAKPDPAVAEKDEPIFTYSVTVDVTDTTGETRSGSRSLQIGYTALQATVSADDWLTNGEPVKLKISTTTIDGQGQSAQGTIKVYSLKQPDKVIRVGFFGRPSPRPVRRVPGRVQPKVAVTPPMPDPADPRTWELGEQVSSSDFTTPEKGEIDSSVKLGVGIYRAMLETSDRFGKPVKAMVQFQVIDPAANKLSLKIPNLFAAPKWKLEPGEEFSAVWGTGYESGKAFIEIEHRQRIISSYWTSGDNTQYLIKQATNELMRGGFQVRVTFIRENRAYLESRQVEVPWTNKELKVKWEHFVSKLEPGKKETWTAVLTGPDARKAVAEMAAACYDASLDAYLPHQWMQAISVFYQDRSYLNTQFQNYQMAMYQIAGMFPQQFLSAHFHYRQFPADITANLWRYLSMNTGRPGSMGGVGGGMGAPGAPAREGGMAPKSEAMTFAVADGAIANSAPAKLATPVAGEPPVSPSGPKLDNVSTRTNLNETAFFFPIC